jgi:predicted dehydrogenase
MLMGMKPGSRTPVTKQRRPTLAWLSPAQAGLAGEIAEQAGLRLDLVGCSGADRPGGATELARTLDATPTDDLRSALASSSIEIVLIGSITPDECEHTLLAPDALRGLEQRGVRVFSMAPPPGRIGDPGQGFGSGPGPIEMVPMLRHSPGFQAALTALEAFGSIRTVAISARCGLTSGTLGARLVDAMDAALALLGEPDTIDAAIGAPAGAAHQPETLLELRGDCSALLRGSDGRSASVSLTDQAGPWFRGVTILGERGCLRVEDDAFEWIDPDGTLIERSERTGAGVDPAMVIGQAIVRRLSGVIGPEDPRARLRAISMAEAAALSARTGQAESPAKLLHLAGLTA